MTRHQVYSPLPSQRFHMARKPKSAPNEGDEIRVQDPAGAPKGAPAPRRGRPKSVPTGDPVTRAITTSDKGSNEATAEARDRAADVEEPRVQRRPGPKPKRSEKEGAGRQLASGAQPKRGRKARIPALASAGGDMEAPGSMAQSENTGGGSDAGSGEAGPHSTADRSASIPARAAASTKAAAEWNQATDTVTFDWTAIERTAAQAGPNQVMAKLLVAARAEGANSRWPL